jgi:hypothetical protein
VILNEIKNILKVRSQTGQTSETDGFKEVCSRKRHSTEEAAHTPKKVTLSETSTKVATKNFFAALRTANMDTDASATELSPTTETVMPAEAEKLPPIILTIARNLIQFAKTTEMCSQASLQVP